MPSACSSVRWRPAAMSLALLIGFLAADPARGEPSRTAASRTEPRSADKAGFYGRFGLGVDWPESSGFSDTDCASTQPPALFGCGAGGNGRPLGANGNFATTPVLDAALGYRLSRWFRAEALISWRPDLDFNGQSNFLGAGASQPVSGSVSSLAGFGVAYLDLPPIGRARPFLGAGLGVSTNSVGAMTYAFPSLSATATTTTPGGTSSDLAYLLTAGISVPLGDRFDLDLAYRYTDLGQVQTAGGQAEVVRSSGSRSIAIGGTRANLQSHGVMLSLRYAF